MRAGSVGWWRPHKQFFRACIVLCAASLAGCADGYPSHPVKVDVAQETLRSVMDSWKAGRTTEELQKGSPSIVVQDFDWMGGAKLISYEVVGEGKPMDANLMTRVKLKLRAPDGKESEKTVTYLVGTGPALTVFRDSMH